MLGTLGVAAPLEAVELPGVLELEEVVGLDVAAGPDAGELLGADDDGGVSSATDAGGTLGSPDGVAGGASAVGGGVVSGGAVVTGGGGASTRVSRLHAAIDVAMATALAVIRNLRVNIVPSGLVSGREHPRDMRGV